MKFTEEEKRLFLRMADYFIRSEHDEIEKLKLSSGNDKFIPECEERLAVFHSIKRKVMEEFSL